MSEKQSLWTESEKQMITPDGNIKRYITSDVVDKFNLYDCADISFPNGYNKAGRVFSQISPCIAVNTIKSLVIKVEK